MDLERSTDPAPRSRGPRIGLYSDDVADLKRIHEDDVNHVVWRRPPPALGAACEPAALLRGGALHRHVELTGTIEQDLAAVELVLGEVALPVELAADITSLGLLYLAVSGAARARLRIERSSSDGCRLFHTDQVDLRLLSTYAGPGTDLVPDRAVRRSGLAQGDNDRIIRDWTQVRRLRLHDVALLKGEAYPGNAGGGVVHRSPPIRAAGLTRLYVCVDQSDHC